MSKKEVRKEVKPEVKTEVETMKYKLELPNGEIIEGTTSLRPFQPNQKNGVQNSGFQTKVSSGQYSGSIMMIDYTKQKPI